jgi:hypothetical protein
VSAVDVVCKYLGREVISADDPDGVALIVVQHVAELRSPGDMHCETLVRVESISYFIGGCSGMDRLYGVDEIGAWVMRQKVIHVEVPVSINDDAGLSFAVEVVGDGVDAQVFGPMVTTISVVTSALIAEAAL